MNRVLTMMPLVFLAAPAAIVHAQEMPSIIRRVQVSGARAVPAATLQAAAMAAGAGVGRAGEPEVTRLAADAVVREYRRRGFPLAQVVATDLDPGGTLHITVAEGVVRSIVVLGNKKTRTATVRAAMTTHPGDVYREDQADADRNRLARLGIFEEVSVAPALPDEVAEEAARAGTIPGRPAVTPPDAVGLVDVVVRVKERRTGNLAAAVGFGGGSGLVGYFDLTESNLGGSAQRVSVQWQRLSRARLEEDGTLNVEAARSAYNIAYQVPFLERGRTAYGIEAYNKNTTFQPLFTGDNETLRSYETRRGATARAGRMLGPGVSLFVSARRDEVGYDAIPGRLNPPLAEIAESVGTVGALGLNLVSDTRDAAEDPRNGYFASVRYESAGSFFGGNHSFGRATADLRRYLPLARSSRSPVLALRLLGGTSTGKLPLSEQFWLGGYELLRGYDLDAVRGDRMMLASAEARLPVAPGIQGALFLDYGNAWKREESFSLTDLRAGLGVGLRLLSPIGPIRLDAAYGSDFNTYVSLGHAY